MSLRKAKKQSRVQELRAKRISELYLYKKELSPMVISEGGDQLVRCSNSKRW